MKEQLLIIPEDIGKYLSYDEITGNLIWIKSTGRGCNRKYGDLANTVHIHAHTHKKYINIKFRKRVYQAHRIAWFIKTNTQPDEVDHIDGNGLNNKWCNLREASRMENNRNYPKPKTNTSGYKGVSWAKHVNKWLAKICANNKQCHLGYFDDPVLAHEAYCKAADELHGAFANHGNNIYP